MPGLLRTRTPLHRRLAVCRPTARDPGTGLPGVSLCTGVSGTFNDRHRPRSPPIPGFPRSAAQGDRVMVQARVVDRVMVRARVVDRAAEPVCEGQGAWRISCGRIPAEVRGTSAMSVPSTIDHRATGYSLAHAYWLAKASDLAYKDEATIEEQARAWGFDRVRHHQTRFSPPFPLQDTQAYAAASDHMIVTAFRGTEPVQIKDWLSDATTPHHTAPPRARRHRIRPPRLRRRTGIDLPRRRGHPRGVPHQRPDRLVHRPQPRRALAMLADARRYLEEPRLAADGVHTYGQPRTCDRLLAAAYDKSFKNRMYRFVNNNDIVPQMPPRACLHPRQRTALHRLPRQAAGEHAAARLTHRPGRRPGHRSPGTGRRRGARPLHQRLCHRFGEDPGVRGRRDGHLCRRPPGPSADLWLNQ